LTNNFCFNTFNSSQSKFLVRKAKSEESGWLRTGPTDTELKYSGTAGKPGGKQRKQTSTYGIWRNRSTRLNLAARFALCPPTAGRRYAGLLVTKGKEVKKELIDPGIQIGEARLLFF
jgi:hypothetical protein